jgi:AraC family transcriptional regulator
VTLPPHERTSDLLQWVARPSVALYPPAAVHGPRDLSTCEFLWLLQGSAEWECEPERHLLTPGTLLLVRPGMRDRLVFDRRRASRLGTVAFGLSGAGCDPAWPVVRAVGRDDPLRGMTRYLLWLGSREPERWRERVRDVLALMLALFVEGPLPGAAPEPDLPTAFDPILDHVRAAWSTGTLRPLSRSELARAGSMSPGHLSRLFREHCGVGVVAAFESLRLVRAKTLLLRSNLSIGAVAETCGFADPYHFSHRFKAAYGVSPRHFRDGAGAARGVAETSPGVRLLAYRLWGPAAPVPHDTAT